jgi:hypothetical protein
MSTITVTTDYGTAKEFDSRRDAREAKQTHESLCNECGEVDISIAVGRETPAVQDIPDSGHASNADDAPGNGMPADIPESVQTDPLDIVPEYMISEVDGQPTINKRGYAVIANHFDIAVQSEALTAAGETDHEFAEFKATAWKRGDGPEEGYTGHATARRTEDRRGIENNLNEMAETRAMNRAVAWASGVGLLAWEEMIEHVDDR